MRLRRTGSVKAINFLVSRASRRANWLRLAFGFSRLISLDPQSLRRSPCGAISRPDDPVDQLLQPFRPGRSLSTAPVAVVAALAETAAAAAAAEEAASPAPVWSRPSSRPS